MSVMELAEVVSPHFAVPVVGVVLCAVLVFAFGFKSSVQPPSFDFEKDEKHRLRQKAHRKPKKPQSNGHVMTVEAHVTQVAKSTSPKPTSSPKSLPTEKAEGGQRSKVKKTSASSKAKPEVQLVTKSVREEDSAPGEWVPAKTRKRKQKKEDAKDGSDSAPEVDVKPEPKIEVVPEPKAEPKVESKIEAKPELKTEQKAKTELKTEQKAKTELKTEQKAKTELKTEQKAKTELKTEQKAKTELKTEQKAKTELKTEQKAKTELKTEQKAKTELKTEQKATTELKTEQKAKTELKTEQKAKAKTDPKPEAVSAPITESPLEKRVSKKDRKKKETTEKAATPEIAPAGSAFIPEPAKKTTPEPTKKTIPEPAKKNTPEPAKKNTPEPAKKTTPEPAKNTTPEPAKKTTPESAKKTTPETAKKTIPEPAKKITPEPAKKTTPEPAKKTAPKPDAVFTAESGTEEKTVTSPKKKSKKKAKVAPAEVAAVKGSEVIVEVNPEVNFEDVRDPIQAALEAAAADDDTLNIKAATKSPKQIKKSKESRDKYQESMPHAKLTIEALAAASTSSSASGEPSLALNTDGDTGRLKVTSLEGDAIASSSPSSDSARAGQTESTKVISFDELGDWQEAKPIKKRRKARRDN